jgi:hypothetical protein
MLQAFLATYAAVFVAEIVGDTVALPPRASSQRASDGARSSRGMSVRVHGEDGRCRGGRRGDAGSCLTARGSSRSLTAVSFIGVAIAMWRKPRRANTPKEKGHAHVGVERRSPSRRSFFSEWGDKGMTTAGVWAAAYVSSAASRGMSRTSVALLVWVAAFLAMVTKRRARRHPRRERSVMDREPHPAALRPIRRGRGADSSRNAIGTRGHGILVD